MMKIVMQNYDDYTQQQYASWLRMKARLEMTVLFFKIPVIILV
jgi:hypothetical protein